MIKLDFNFTCKKFSGVDSDVYAAAALINVFDYGQGTDQMYNDKKEEWGKQLNETGQIECDLPDAKKIREMVDRANIFDFVRHRLLKYLDEQIMEKKK